MMNREDKIMKALNSFRYGNVVDLYGFKYFKQKLKSDTDVRTSGNFTVVNINEEGFIELKLDNQDKIYKVLVRTDRLNVFSVGDQINCILTRRLFFVYEEVLIVKKIKLIK